ncbi:G/U mismatch-specific uracil-DNA glycosylase [Nitrosomonas cryotolerans]|uniref:G/U mismatch-specific uracil-DNA glycosylase n=1 Tax=Nitrosomonas cryotolerans ATCC 49181 TaxID=1131553 RepID=A0A1N6FL43_9PROT|nr:DNA-deoxyinosine glycosylase [Nitrosomonas cryotolerans]SFP82349.1 G/U mismatch-specific uracil-DNA glycosylase [Nitrosomonas cryotolerans]SIN95965.1 G/U mismatch-specific uracil-DNA glycosylase [Nitrosomonas cryotolerans ATCC 49181]
MTYIHSFAPIENSQAEILILGSMPSQKSLANNQYYAHPQNAFWRIISDLLQLNPDSSYEEKTQALKAARIALWDVLQSCERKGSLDSMIKTETQTVNDFQTFFQTHKAIKFVYFNGAKAEICFKQQVLRKINSETICYMRLPSTSPANAAISFERKLAIWRLMLGSRLDRDNKAAIKINP